jgi:hypothetical protein
MFNKLNEFLDGFEQRNLFNDEALGELTKKAKGIINGVSPLGISYNEEMRTKIKTEMENLNRSIVDAIEDLPRRKLKLAA